MKLSILTIFVASTICINSFSQDHSLIFGELSEKDKTFNTYAKDKEAEAVVLFDIGEAYFSESQRGGYDIRFTRTRRIKILDNAGLGYAKVSIPMYLENEGLRERVTSIEAFTYNIEDGQVKRYMLTADGVFEEKYRDSYRRKKFTFPKAQAGSIIEYRYVLETPFMFNLPDWEFQDRIPTLHSEYTVKMIPFYEYSFLAQGIGKFTAQSSRPDTKVREFGNVTKAYGTNVGNGIEFRDMIHKYLMKDVPAFRDETYITSVNDYIMKIDFQLARINYPNGTKKDIITTWEDMVESYMKSDHFGKYMNRSKKEAAKFLKSHPEIAGMEMDEKARFLVNFVKKNYEWDGFYLKYARKSPKEFQEQKTGSSSEINLYLTALLKAAGIKATPVLVSTREHGRVHVKYPYEHFFNHVLVLVNTPSEEYLADASDNWIAYNRIPPECMNGSGLLIAEEGVHWIPISDKLLSRDQVDLEIEIEPNSLSALVKLKQTASEYEGYQYRYAYNNNMDELEEYLENQGLKEIRNLETQNYTRTTEPYSIAVEGNAELEMLENQIIIQPFLNFPIRSNPLTQENRTYPIDMIYANESAFKTFIGIPEGYKAIAVPEDFKTDNAMMKLVMETTTEGDQIVVEGSYTFKKPVYNSKEYRMMKHYMDYIIEKFNEPVVLEKIEAKP